MAVSYDFVIVGGGMNGVNLAAHFLRKGVSADRIRIIDRHKSPILLWFEMTRQVGMEQVRSPLVHHLGGSEDSLEKFVSTCTERTANAYDPVDPYRRPRLRVFNEYLRNIITKYDITTVFKQGHVVGAKPIKKGGFIVSVADDMCGGEPRIMQTRHLILAVGYHDNRYIPAWNQTLCESDMNVRDLQRIRWIQDLKNAGADIHHIYEADFDADKLSSNESTIVVGGGFSGVQLALKLAERKHKTVTLLIEYPIEVHHFDADPVWAKFSSNEMKAFLKKGLAERRKVIQEARNQGSISPDLKIKLDHAIKDGQIKLVLGDTQTAQYKGDKVTLHVELKDSKFQDISSDRVVLATGYRLNIRPGGVWIDDLEKELSLPTHDCYPVLNDKTLQWGSCELYIAGQLAELSLGPLARNIAGTQLSASRITNAPNIRRTILNKQSLQASSIYV